MATAVDPLAPKRLRRVLVGRPMQTGQMHETLLPKWLALPIFASDPLSSVAYATESALVVLVAVGGDRRPHLVFPISLAIAFLLGIVVLSYRQTVRVYETSGGAYIVARENLGTTPSLVAAAALLTDYVLTVAVSISAGIFAITSFAPSLQSHKVGLSLALPARHRARQPPRRARVGAPVRAADLRVRRRRSSLLDAVGIVQYATGHLHARRRAAPLRGGHSGRSALFILLRAFSSGSTALTGRGGDRERRQRVPAPAGEERLEDARHPRRDSRSRCSSASRSSRCTSTRCRARPTRSSRSSRGPSSSPGSLGGVHVLRRPGDDAARPRPRREHVVPGIPAALGAACARPLRAAAVLEPRRPPRLLERDARARRRRAALLVVYKANTDSLIHLYVIGVFTAFTLSQAGMVRYWLRIRGVGLAAEARRSTPSARPRPVSSR